MVDDGGRSYYVSHDDVISGQPFRGRFFVVRGRESQPQYVGDNRQGVGCPLTKFCMFLNWSHSNPLISRHKNVFLIFFYFDTLCHTLRNKIFG